jgi:hypothetical protein
LEGGMTTNMKILSLFSGCGGMDLGFQKAGFEVVVFCVTQSWRGGENRMATFFLL